MGRFKIKRFSVWWKMARSRASLNETFKWKYPWNEVIVDCCQNKHKERAFKELVFFFFIKVNNRKSKSHVLANIKSETIIDDDDEQKRENHRKSWNYHNSTSHSSYHERSHFCAISHCSSYSLEGLNAFSFLFLIFLNIVRSTCDSQQVDWMFSLRLTHIVRNQFSNVTVNKTSRVREKR